MRSISALLLLLATGQAGFAQSGALSKADHAPVRSAPYEASVRDDYRASDDYRGNRYDDQDDYYDQGRLGVRVWLDQERDLFHPGDVTRALVRPSQDAYVAVLQITPDGDVEVLWPRNYSDDGYMEGGRTYAVYSRAGGRYLRVGNGYGLGYVMAVASDEPLDLRGMRGYYYRSSYGWDSQLNVYGDPFRAMERFARMLVPDYDDGYGAVDWYSYSVGSTRYEYPRYACYDGYGAWYTSRSPYYGGCDRVRVLLRTVPYYYDTRYYRGDRSRYWRQWYASDYHVRRQPQHGYKEGGYGYDQANGSPNRRTFTQRMGPSRNGSGSTVPQDPDGQGGGVRAPSRQRPTLERRPPESEPVRVYSPPQRSFPRDEPREEPRSRGESTQSEPRVREAPPERSAPRAEPRSEPRSEPRPAPPPRDEGSSGRSRPSESPRVRPPQG